MSALFTLLCALVPAWLKAALSCAGALLGVGVFAWLKGRSAAAQVAHEKDQVATAIVTNHAVEQKETAATTDQEADDALDAAARADHS